LISEGKGIVDAEVAIKNALCQQLRLIFKTAG